MATAGQTCTGSFGEPVVNITFGSGVMPGPSSSTNYNYTSNGCPSDGSYTIVSSTSGCFGTWHTLTEDHTPGDNSGYMMLVNSSNTPGEFYRETINTLCPGTTYEFAAYVVNVLRAGTNGNKPNLTFIIESVTGNVLSSYTTGDIQEVTNPVWEKYGMTFKTPPGISQVVLKIINNAPGGRGNDLALDDITFRACGPSIQANVNGNLKTVYICPGQSISVAFHSEVSSGFDNPAYQWQVKKDANDWEDIPDATSASTNLYISEVTSIGHQYRLAVAEGSNINSPGCRVFSNPVPVAGIPEPTVSAGPDKITIQGKPVKLISQATGNDLSFNWSPSLYLDDPSSPEPISTPQEDITYTLTVKDSCDQMITDEVFVKVHKQIIIPNTFTPNGDGVNDLWNIPGFNSYSDGSLKVFNRYGEIVFKCEGYDKPWDGQYNGRIMSSGQYYYIIDLKNGSELLSGSVLIIR
ncbi:MAG TPA: gliding motility-associated C-terminal domain-containing protein [Sphingobacteriaceae bacterium]